MKKGIKSQINVEPCLIMD